MTKSTTTTTTTNKYDCFFQTSPSSLSLSLSSWKYYLVHSFVLICCVIMIISSSSMIVPCSSFIIIQRRPTTPPTTMTMIPTTKNTNKKSEEEKVPLLHHLLPNNNNKPLTMLKLQLATSHDDNDNNNNNNNDDYSSSGKDTPSTSTTATPSTTTKSSSSSSSSSSYFISQDQLKMIQDSVDLVSVIESYGLPKFKYTSVDKNSATCCCPFHDDNNPSMSIDNKRGIYKCFSCGASGNVFNFVQEYSKLLGSKQNELSFYQTVNEVNEKYSSTSIPLLLGSGGGGVDNNNNKNNNTATNNEKRIQQRQRILNANSIALQYYESSLKELSGGAARQHIRNRGFNGNTIYKFHLGYAPECYFTYSNNDKQQKRKSWYQNQWGYGSLVNHLRNYNFTPNEIFDSGLAIRINNNNKNKNNNNNMMSKNNNSTDDDDDMDYTNLMDRFRGRLVVPIFDNTGKNVLGFGGRQLTMPTSTTTATDGGGGVADTQQQRQQHYSPKYLNSPETIVFQKKNILFGRHMAQNAIQSSISSRKTTKTTKDDSSMIDNNNNRPIVIVEGYMDAIALWQAGIKEVVSCMGTALTSEQLFAAARLQNNLIGRVVLCLDNDKAGIGAIERLCSGSILSSVAEQCSVEFLVASLPDGIKDPAEFVEEYTTTTTTTTGSRNSDVEEQFRHRVLDTAIEWTQWYIDRIISTYDGTAARGTSGSFGAIFDRLAGFLAGFPNAAERTKRAVELGSTLAEILAAETNTTKPSKTVRDQLESDLIEKASMIANERSAISKRINVLSGGGESKHEMKNVLANLMKGGGDGDEDARMSGSSRKNSPPPQLPVGSQMDGNTQPFKTTGVKPPPETVRSKEEEEVAAKWMGARRPTTTQSTRRFSPRKKSSRQQRNSPTLTPHFSGFDFSPNDERWLGLVDKKGKRKPDALLPDNIRNKMGELNELGQKRVVYFNSNEYHGNRFISEQALEAGYKNTILNRNPDMFNKGIASALSKDGKSDATIIAAENQLLRVMVLYASARRAVTSMLEANSVSDSSGMIEWSAAEKEWLFERLTSRQNQLPSNIVGPEDIEDLRLHLMKNAADTFPKAISPSAVTRDGIVNVSEEGQHFDKALLFETGSNKTISEIGDSGSNKTISEIGDSEYLLSNETSLATTEGPTSTFDEKAEIVKLQMYNIPNDDDTPNKSAGMLDCFFSKGTIPEDNMRGSISPEEKAELAAQDYFSSLMLISQKKQLSQKIKFLADATSTLFRHNKGGPEEEEETEENLLKNETKSDPSTGSEASSISFRNMTLEPDGLKEMCSHLSSEIQTQVKHIQSLTEAHRRITSRLMETSARNVRSKDQQETYDEIIKNMKQHMSEVDKWSAPLPADELDDDDEPYEDYLERVRNEMGELYEDDRMWTPDDIVDKLPPLEVFNMEHLLSESSDDDTESIEQFEARMSRDWGWVENETQTKKPAVDVLDLSGFSNHDHSHGHS